MDNSGRARLKDIAARAGITMTSVSRALKGCSNISKATQEKVRAIALEMGYISNPHAQSLRNGHFPVIAIVHDNFKNPFYSIVSGMIETHIREHNYRSMMFNEFNKDSRLCLDTALEISAFNLSGVVTYLVPTQEAIALFKRHNIPVIILGREGAELDIDSVSSNDFHGGYLAGQHLVESGCRHFAYIGAFETLPINQYRYRGFAAALAERGFTSNIYFNNDNESTKSMLDKALADDGNLNGIFCFNDLIAFEVVNHLMERKIKIPQEVSVVGYDNLQRQINYPFRLTTIDADMSNMATLVIETMFKQLENGGTERINKVIDVTLVQGKTTKKQ